MVISIVPPPPGNSTIDTLKVSLTNDCNLNCLYCKPSGRQRDFANTEQTLQASDLQRIIRAAVNLGINKAVVTGGEPLLRKDCSNLVKVMANNRQIRELRLITNGTFLKTYADHLYKAGLRKIEINLDTLNFAKYQKITGHDSLYRVLDGIRKAEECGYDFIKINILVLRGVNDEEIIDFAMISKDKPYHLYFCEYRPHSQGKEISSNSNNYISISDVKKKINHFQPLIEIIDDSGREQAVTRYRFKDGRGTINFCCQTDITKKTDKARLIINSAAEIYHEDLPSRRISFPKLGGKELSDEKLAGYIQRIIEAKQLTKIQAKPKSGNLRKLAEDKNKKASKSRAVAKKSSSGSKKRARAEQSLAR